MTETVEYKQGTEEELQKDLETCGAYQYDSSEVDLETAFALTRAKLDVTIRNIISESGLSLSLFDYVLMSIMADIRKADADTLRMNNIPTKKVEEQNGNTK